MALSAVRMTHRAALRLRRSQSSRSFRSLYRLQGRTLHPVLVLWVLRRILMIEKFGELHKAQAPSPSADTMIIIYRIHIYRAERRQLVHLQLTCNYRFARPVRVQPATLS